MWPITIESTAPNVQWLVNELHSDLASDKGGARFQQPGNECTPGSSANGENGNNTIDAYINDAIAEITCWPDGVTWMPSRYQLKKGKHGASYRVRLKVLKNFELGSPEFLDALATEIHEQLAACANDTKVNST